MIETPQHRTWRTKLVNAARDYKPEHRFELPNDNIAPLRERRSPNALLCQVLSLVIQGKHTTSDIQDRLFEDYAMRASCTAIRNCLSLAVHYGVLNIRVQPLPQDKIRYIYFQPGHIVDIKYRPNLTLEKCNERCADDAPIRKWWI